MWWTLISLLARSIVLRASMFLAILLGFTRPASTQAPRTAPDWMMNHHLYCTADWADASSHSITEALARKYSPLLEFSPGEVLFPTIPFFTAFDRFERTGVRWNPRRNRKIFNQWGWEVSKDERWMIFPFQPEPPPVYGAEDSLLIAPMYTAAPIDTARSALEPDQPFVFTWPNALRARSPWPYTYGARSPWPHTASARSLVNWDTLRSAYERRSAAADTPRDTLARSAAVFYHSRCLSERESRTVWRLLRNDDQAWTRQKLAEVYNAGLKNARFQTLEYYLYYVDDRGLQGHPHDIEKVFIFIPTLPLPQGQDLVDDDAIARSELLLSSFLLIVGAGHSSSTPNNILVVRAPLSRSLRNPAMFVELGGHSMAPDVDYDGVFTPGIDVNVNLGATLWGVRDAQAVSGLAYLGDYRSWMTLPRTPTTSATLRLNTIAADTTDHQAIEALYERSQGRRRDANDYGVRAASSQNKYVLLPVRLLREIYDSLTPGLTSGPPYSLPEGLLPLINDSLRRYLAPWKYGGFQDDSAGIVRSFMEAWKRPMTAARRDTTVSTGFASIGVLSTTVWSRDTLGPERWMIWRNREYVQEATNILKARLYRPTLDALEDFGDVASLVGLGFGAYLGAGGQQVQAVVVIPTSRSFLSVPGVLEAQGGWYRRRITRNPSGRERLALGVLYERHYRSTFSWYAKVGWLADRSVLENDSLATNTVLGIGVSLMPLFPIAEKLGPLEWLAEDWRIRLGLRLDLPHAEPRVSRLEVASIVYPF